MKSDRYILEFSHENPAAARYELTCISLSGTEFEILELEDEYAIITGSPERIFQSAFVNTACKILEERDKIDDLEGFGLPEGSFFLRVKDFNGCHNSTTEPVAGRLIQGNREVNFVHPDFKARLFHKDKWLLTVVVYEKDKKGMESRRAPLRPFFSPIAIHPKYARYLVNTTITVPGDLVMDPFCGTGGILLEASLMGRRIIGNDFSLNMVKGARLNLKYFNIKGFAIHNEDIADLKIDINVDAIATDFPYGRNSNMKAESIVELYRIAFRRFHDWLKPEGRCSIIVSDTKLMKYAEGLFNVEHVVGVPQHRSLTRYFVTMQKI